MTISPARTTPNPTAARSQRYRQGRKATSFGGRRAHPELSRRELAREEMKPSLVIPVAVRGDQHVDTADLSRPQVRGDHPFAHVEPAAREAAAVHHDDLAAGKLDDRGVTLPYVQEARAYVCSSQRSWIHHAASSARRRARSPPPDGATVERSTARRGARRRCRARRASASVRGRSPSATLPPTPIPTRNAASGQKASWNAARAHRLRHERRSRAGEAEHRGRRSGQRHQDRIRQQADRGHTVEVESDERGRADQGGRGHDQRQDRPRRERGPLCSAGRPAADASTTRDSPAATPAPKRTRAGRRRQARSRGTAARFPLPRGRECAAGSLHDPRTRLDTQSAVIDTDLAAGTLSPASAA